MQRALLGRHYSRVSPALWTSCSLLERGHFRLVNQFSVPHAARFAAAFGPYFASADDTGAVRLRSFSSRRSHYTLFGERHHPTLLARGRGFAPVVGLSTIERRPGYHYLAVCHLFAARIPVWGVWKGELFLRRSYRVPQGFGVVQVEFAPHSHTLVGRGHLGRILVWLSEKPKLLCRPGSTLHRMAVMRWKGREVVALAYARCFIEIRSMQSGEVVDFYRLSSKIDRMCSVGQSLAVSSASGQVALISPAQVDEVEGKGRALLTPIKTTYGPSLVIYWRKVGSYLFVPTPSGWRRLAALPHRFENLTALVHFPRLPSQYLVACGGTEMFLFKASGRRMSSPARLERPIGREGGQKRASSSSPDQTPSPDGANPRAQSSDESRASRRE